MLFNSVVSWYFKKRIQQVQYGMENAVEVQNDLFFKLLEAGKSTGFGKKHGFDSITDRDSYRTNIPVQS